jgi:pimeloyl-ACP methyl ester carboxylesterase
VTDPAAGPPSSTPLTIAANGFEFDALEWGPPDGRPVLLLHGFPQAATAWAGVASRLASAGLRAVAVNQRGYSPGARPGDVSAYSLPDLESDVVAMIDVLGGPVDLVGHDWGGAIGWGVAGRHPERVRTWTAVSTPHSRALYEVLAAEGSPGATPPAHGDPTQAQRFAYQAVFRLPGKAEAILLADDAAKLRALYGGAVAPERVAADVAFFQQPGVLTLALNWYRGTPGAALTMPPTVTVPTTYVWGSADLAFGRAAAEATASTVDADYRFVPLEGVSHWVLDQAPDVLAAEIVARVSSVTV